MTEFTYAQIKEGRLKERFLIFKLHALLTSAPLAWLFYQCGLSANGVTVLGMLLGIPVAALNLAGHYYWAIALFHLFFLLDGADGTLARGTRSTSTVGAYLDDFSHYVFHGLFFISMGLGLARHGSGVAGVLAMAAGFSNTLNRAHQDLKNSESRGSCGQTAQLGPGSIFRALRASVLGSFDFPNILVFMTATAWSPRLLNTYLAYCAAANLSYLVYSGVQHVSELKRFRSSGIEISRVTAD